MKIIEALKGTKMLMQKAEDLRNKIGQYCADMDHETPTYGTAEQQRQQVSEWLQAHFDVLKEIERLRVALARTNILTIVSIELDGKTVSKPLTAWIARRKELAVLDAAAWKKLTDKNLKEGRFQESSGAVREVRIRRYYDAAVRDAKLDALQTEPFLIDSRLEIVNATTDLIEA